MRKLYFSADTYIKSPDAASISAAIIQYFQSDAEIDYSSEHLLLKFNLGEIIVSNTNERVKIEVKSSDKADLEILKYSIAEYILEVYKQEKIQQKIEWEGDGRAGSPLSFLRIMRVISACNITPHMRRIRLAGENIERFSKNGLHVRLLLPPLGGTKPHWPVMGADGRPKWPEGDHKLIARVYTIRNINAAEGWVEIDIVTHADDNLYCPGAHFASSAKRGDIVGMMGPGGGSVAAGADWYLLAGDETALPAIGRILENLPASAKASVRIEIDNAAEQQELKSDAELDLQWLFRNGAKAGTTKLLYESLRAINYPDIDSNLFIWVGCEFSAFRAIRNFLQKEKRIPKSKQLVVAYWRRGTTGDDAG